MDAFDNYFTIEPSRIPRRRSFYVIELRSVFKCIGHVFAESCKVQRAEARVRRIHVGGCLMPK